MRLQTKLDSGNPQEPTAASPLHRKLAIALFLFLVAETIFSVPYRSVFLALHSVAPAWAAGLATCAFAAFCYRRRDAILAPLRCLASCVAGRQTGWSFVWWNSFWWMCGLAVRIAWAAIFPIHLKSDGEAYFSIARDLAAGMRYPEAYWPPGFPLFLAPFVWLLGDHVWISVLCALLLFTAAYWAMCRLAELLCPGIASRIAAPLLAVWPTYVAVTGVNSKEALLAPLITASLYLYLKAGEAARPARWCLLSGAGVLIGFAALTQPSFLLFPTVLLLAELPRNKPASMALVSTALVSVAAVLTILPWTVRNYRLFHHIVPISTNGGTVFYGANHPHADAGYSASAEEDFPNDELTAQREGYREGVEWIRHNPGEFAALVVRRQVLYLGDDGVGVYETLKRGLEPSPLWYALAKAICNIFWLACWMVLLLGLPALFRSHAWPLWYGVCFLPLLYQWGIDSLLAAGGRHHLPYVGLIAIMVGIVLAKPPDPASSAGQGTGSSAATYS